MDADQPPLFQFSEENLLLLPRDEIRKRYTVRDAGRIEGLRQAVTMLLSARWPAETIAREMHISRRTVEAIAVQSSAEVANFSKEYARILVGVGSEFLALARTKQHEATFKDLMVGFGIVTQRSQELNSTGESGEENEFQTGDDPGAVAAEVLRLVRGHAGQAGPVIEQPPQSNDIASLDHALNCNDLRRIDATGAVSGSVEDLAGGGDLGAVAAGAVDAADGEGGGSASVGGGAETMEPNDGGLLVKAGRRKRGKNATS